VGVGRCASLGYNERYDKASMSTTHDVVNEPGYNRTKICILWGRGCVVCAQVRMGPGSRSKVWDPGPWIQCVLQS
jgi:hypothetical protein